VAQALRQAGQRNPDTEVRLRADTAVPYGRVVELMGQAHLGGLHRIGFVADTAAAKRQLPECGRRNFPPGRPKALTAWRQPR
jgi:biopolymer transport protein TolR